MLSSGKVISRWTTKNAESRIENTPSKAKKADADHINQRPANRVPASGAFSGIIAHRAKGPDSALTLRESAVKWRNPRSNRREIITMLTLMDAYCAVRRTEPTEETIFEAVLSVLATAWCGFMWYVVAWLLVG